MKNNESVIIGILPVMLDAYKLYDSKYRVIQEKFVNDLAAELNNFAKIEIAQICSERQVVQKEITHLAQLGVKGLVVLFTSYAPSMILLEPLLSTTLPILLFNTSPKAEMGEGYSMTDILFNHGLHGNMDLANMLTRNKRKYSVVAGYYRNTRILGQIDKWISLCCLLSEMNNSKIGITGNPFDGMGDLGIDYSLIHSLFGTEVVTIPSAQIAISLASVKEEEIITENERDKQLYKISDDLDDEILNESNRLYLAISKILRDREIMGYTMNYQDFLSFPGIMTHPFWALSKLQSEGIGYAGEGDVFGAVFCTIMQQLFGKALFSEPFCPDYGNGRLIMGHMGEANPSFGIETILRKKLISFGAPINPVVADVHMREQQVTVSNLAVIGGNRVQLTAFRGHICPKVMPDTSVDMPCFHLQPEIELTELLTGYGNAGASHHVVITEGDCFSDLKLLADWYDFSLVLIK